MEIRRPWMECFTKKIRPRQRRRRWKGSGRSVSEDLDVSNSINLPLDLRPRNPVVFCHGLLGFDSVTLGVTFAPLQITHWRGIKEVLEQNGVEVLITKVPATSGVDERAKVLEARIAEEYPGRKIHLIGQFRSYWTQVIDQLIQSTRPQYGLFELLAYYMGLILLLRYRVV
jgi:hypothetical protein